MGRIRLRLKSHDPYLIVNVIFAGIILLLIVYSGIFSADTPHPIKSAHANPVISTGLSRAFSEIVRGNFSAALAYNPYSISIFLFFFIQFFLRVIFFILMFRNIFSKNHLVLADILLSVLLFLRAFGRFIIDQI